MAIRWPPLIARLLVDIDFVTVGRPMVAELEIGDAILGSIGIYLIGCSLYHSQKDFYKVHMVVFRLCSKGTARRAVPDPVKWATVVHPVLPVAIKRLFFDMQGADIYVLATFLRYLFHIQRVLRVNND